MPTAPVRPCSRPGCPKLQPCPVHGARPNEATSTARRQDAPYRRLYDRQAWRKASREFLRGKVCERCGVEGTTRLATVTDHRLPHKGDTALFWSRDNWRGLCVSCHMGVRSEQVERERA